MSSSTMASSVETTDTCVTSFNSAISVSIAQVAVDVRPASQKPRTTSLGRPISTSERMPKLPAKRTLVLTPAYQYPAGVHGETPLRAKNELVGRTLVPLACEVASKDCEIRIVIEEVDSPLPSPGVGLAF